MNNKSIKRRDFLKATTAVSLFVTTSLLSADNKKENTLFLKKNSNTYSEQREGTLIRADMLLCSPVENLSRNFEINKWALIDFESAEGVKGFMVSARPDEECGELTLPLEAKGFYKIYLGIHETKSHYRGRSSYGQMEIKLTNDQGFRRFGPEDDT